jgi:hypothetical protein
MFGLSHFIVLRKDGARVDAVAGKEEIGRALT